MRRWLVLAALAGALIAMAIWFARRHANDAATAKSQTVQSSDAKSAAPKPEPIVAPNSDAVREPTTPPPVPTLDPTKPTRLRVQALARENQVAMPRVRIRASPKPSPANGWTTTESDESAGTTKESLVTNEEGVVAFDLDSNVAQSLSADALDPPFGHGTLEVAALAAGETREVKLELTRDADRILCGKVVRADGGEPIANATIRVVDPDWRREENDETESELERGGVVDRLTSDETGAFAVRFPSWRKQELAIQADGFALAAVPLVDGHATPDVALIVKLSATATLAVRVVDPNGVEQPEVDVAAHVDANRLAHGELWNDFASAVTYDGSATTDFRGHAEIRDVPPDVPIQIAVLRHEIPIQRRSDPVTLKAGERRELTITVGNGVLIVGLVLNPDGLPAPNQEIWLARPTPTEGLYFRANTSTVARTAATARGEFTFSDVAEGEWLVGPPCAISASDSIDPNAIAPRAERVVCEPGATSVGVVVHLSRGLYLSGRVVDESGAGVGVHVGANANDGAGFRWADAHADGSFAIGPLADGDYEINAGGFGAFAQSETLKVHAGAKDLVLHVTRAATVHGTVIDAASGAPSDANIFVSSASDSHMLGGITGTNTQAGKFEVGGLAKGRYDFVAEGRNATIGTARVELAAGDSKELTIRLERGATLQIDNRSNDFIWAQVRANDAELPPDGVDSKKQAERVVPAGSLVIRFVDASGKELGSPTLSIGAGETKTVTFPSGG